jgi:hypothetical protein
MLPCRCLYLYQNFFTMCPSFDLKASGSKLLYLAIESVIHHLPQSVLCHILFVQFFVRQVACVYRSQTVWFIHMTSFLAEENQLLSVPHIWAWSLELITGYLVIGAARHSTNYNYKHCIWQCWDITSCILAGALPQIHRRSLVALPSLLRRLPNFTCRVL